MRSLWLLVFIAAAAGCGRTRLFDSLGSGAGAVATGGSAAGGSGGAGAFAGTGGGITGGSAGTGGSGGTPACTTWSVAQASPVPLTDPTGDSMLTSLHADGSHVFVGTMNDDDPSPDPTWRVRVVKDDLSDLGTSHVVMTHPESVSIAGLGVAIGSGHRGAVAWDDAQGCRFVELGPDGAAIAPPRTIAKTWCYWPVATQSGYIVFDSPAFTFTPLGLITLDAQGQQVKVHSDVISVYESPNDTFPRGIARFDDGTLLVAWNTGGGVTSQHLDADGNKLAPVAFLMSSGPNAHFAMASMGNSGLAVLGADTYGPSNDVLVKGFDEDGKGNTAPVQVSSATGFVGHVAVARAGGVALVAWALGASGAANVLHVRAVGFDAKPIGPVLTAPAPDFIGSVRLVGIPAGALLVYEAQRPNTPTQVFADRLVCH